MEENIKWLLFQIIYEELDLKSFESQIKDLHIQPKKIVTQGLQPISQYFFLKNDLSFDGLTPQEKEKLFELYNEYYSSKVVKGEFLECLNRLKFKLLFPNLNEKYYVVDYDGMNHVAPVDSIVLAFHFIEFDDSYSDETLSNLYGILNQIQSLSTKVGYKVAVLEYNERLLNAVKL